jgi:riboflavin transporter FmnP
MWESRKIALVIVFSALTIVLDPIRVPSVYLMGVSYRFCEIPIVAASILFGLEIGIPVAIMNMVIEIILFPNPASIIGVPFVFILTLSMLFGIHIAFKLFKHKATKNANSGITQVKYFTLLGTLFRTAPAPFVVGFLYRFMFPIVGLDPSDEIIIGLMPAFAFYAFTFSLYTIPIGYLIAKTVSRSLKENNRLHKND